MHIFHNTKFDFLRWRWHAVVLSWAVVIAGIVVGWTKGVPLGLEFAGGTAVVVQFETAATIQNVRQALDQNFPGGGGNVIVQAYGDPSQREVMIRVPQVGTEGGTSLSATRTAVESALRAGSLGNFTIVGSEIVSPTVGRDLSQKGLSAFVLSLIGILAYIAFRFEFSFAVGAVIATIHDIFVTFAFLAFFQYDLTLNVIAALLTVTGYSTNDTIVIFDRVRENLRSMRSLSLHEVVNISLNQTLGRTVITAGTTLMSSIALFLFGGEVLNGFAFTMIVGVITGTYSSVFVAATIVTFWNRKRRRPAAQPATSGDAAAGQGGKKPKRARAS